MKITELIEKLKDVQKKHGDLIVVCGENNEIDDPRFYSSKTGQYDIRVMLSGPHVYEKVLVI